MNQVDHYDLLNWSGSWPMGFRGRRKWKLRFVTMTEVKSLRCCWSEDGQRTLRTVHRRISEDNWLNKRHCILSRSREPSIEIRPFVIVVKGVVMDGNHLLLALIERHYRGKVLIAETSSKRIGKHLWVPKDR